MMNSPVIEGEDQEALQEDLGRIKEE